MASERTTPRTVWLLLMALWAIGSLRAFLLWSHDPLHAYANSYDQTRYTSCFDVHPDRPASIPPQQNSPQAPYARYRFIAGGEPMCYWSSELAFTGAGAAIWALAESFGGGPVHDVRWVGALRWLALLALSIALSRAWLRRGDARAALANAALLPMLFADPGNTLYLNTFYAEWTALLAGYATFALALLWRDEARSASRFALLALAALLLATSKIQHLVLPLGLAATVFVLDRVRLGATSWRALALGAGAFAGCWLQVAQLHREGAMMDAIDQYNRADVVFTALLPFADDPRALLEELHVDPDCAIYSGRHAWEFPDLPERVCRGLVNFDRGLELRTLAAHPRIALRLAGHAPLALDPWIAKNLGQIEGGEFATIAALPSLGRLLHAWPWLQLALLAAPLLALLVLLVHPGPRRGARALDFTALVAVTMLGTLTVTILGDGLADTAKQGHLVVNAGLAWLFAMLVSGAMRRFRPD
ncbi:hypothetical protein [Dokdonella fugitiva]|uniref:glycan biosynthesis hexose transferase WsfD n=1 Tax=Dokdonella fugitiva TaxID=328517 RepID=UPI0015FD668D|nr:hypothetical protein [Dokdonella fugitiva]MBA8882898.1 hypothetical protein [Dokdonella fugitiva]